MRKLLSLVLITLSFNTWGIEFHGNTIHISNKYYSGSFLIFDCEDSRWACVDEDGFKDCKKARVLAKEKFLKNLACSPVKDFETPKACRDYQQSKINVPEFKNHCLHEEVRKGTTH